MHAFLSSLLVLLRPFSANPAEIIIELALQRRKEVRMRSKSRCLASLRYLIAFVPTSDFPPERLSET